MESLIYVDISIMIQVLNEDTWKKIEFYYQGFPSHI
jgi:hypothetical protein